MAASKRPRSTGGTTESIRQIEPGEAGMMMQNVTPNRGPLCEAAVRFMDSRVKSGQPSGADAEILKHIEECSDCSAEFALRARIADGLKHAVQTQAEAPYLAARIKRSIRQRERVNPAPWKRVWRWATTTAALAVCLGGWLSYHFGHLRLTPGSQEAYIAGILEKVTGILRVGLGDHVHCAVFRKFPGQPPSAAVLVAELGSKYGGLLSLVQARVPREYTIRMAHRCSYRGREFVHLALKGGSGLLSLVITRRAQGESFGNDGLAPVLSEAGLSIYRGSVQRFAIAGFETRDHLVYLVSDLDEQQNLNLTASLARPVRTLLASLEG